MCAIATRVSRRRVALLAVATGLVSAAGLRSRPGAAEAFRWKVGTSLPPAHPVNQFLQQAAEKIAEESGGAMQISLFPSSTLGGDSSRLSQVRSGALEFEVTSGAIVSAYVPPSALSGVAFAFGEYPTVWRAMDGELGAYIRWAIETVGFHPFARVWGNGFRQITTTAHPINEPSDLAGMKIRVPKSRLWAETFSAFGAAPAPLNFVAVYEALRDKAIDGQENPLAVVETSRLFEVQKYCAITNHAWDGLWVLCNQSLWNRLSRPLQEIIARNFDAAGLSQRKEVARLNKALPRLLEAKGMVVNTPAMEPFRRKLRGAGFYDAWRETYGDKAWSLLARYADGLA
jgi:tripartite ATP-independent transporter DctP family solute receptor